MTCSKCGASMAADAKFCGTCGTANEAAAGTRGSEAFMRTMIAPAPKITVPATKTPAPASGTESTPAAVAAVKPASAARPFAAPGPTAAVPVGGAATATTAPAIVTAAPIMTVYDLAGSTLNNRYLVKEQLGEGGFGAVYKGEQIAMGRECAIKVLHGRMARDPQIIGRFKREAQAASVLKAAHTVAIYDFDQTPEGVLYLAMELLHGRSLHAEMQKGPMDFKRVAHIIDGIADSLGEAHLNGVVHRDIKPENVYLETRGVDVDFAKVLDFGIAKIVSGEGQSGPQLTAAGQTLGTVEYMSPEQLMGQPLDGRSDLYALGVLAYELLVGHLPFAHLKTPGELITAHLRTVPQAPSKVNPALGIPEAVDHVVMKLIEKQRDNRYRDAAELQVELRKLKTLEAVPPGAQGESLTTQPSPPPATDKVRPIGGAVSPHAETQRDLRPQRGDTETITTVNRPMKTTYMVAGVVLFLIAAALTAFFLLGGSPPPPHG